MKNLQSKAVLNNGVEMPWFGLGVFKVEEGPELVEAVKSAIKEDTAASIQLQFTEMKKL